jgi:outer membrane protein assembly factor BamD (BamD/ComL family)
MRSHTFRLVTISFAAALIALSCASRPIAIPQDLTAPELIQRAQEATDRNRYNNALQYYQAILERFSYNSEYVCAAEYEIAFIYYKQKKYAQAKSGFNTLLDRYNTPDGELLPPQFRILAIKVLGTIEEKEGGKK